MSSEPLKFQLCCLLALNYSLNETDRKLLSGLLKDKARFDAFLQIIPAASGKEQRRTPIFTKKETEEYHKLQFKTATNVKHLRKQPKIVDTIKKLMSNPDSQEYPSIE